MWPRLLDAVRLALSAQGRSVLATRLMHADELHQTTPFTCEERYPELFDLVAELKPTAQRVLSFGCSTGEELSSIRRRFPRAEIVGAEINPRSKRLAAARMRGDGNVTVVNPDQLHGTFDVIFALAVFQREPQGIIAMGVTDLSPYYPFARFDASVRRLSALLRPSGVLCVANAQYRIEDSSVAGQLEPVASSITSAGPLFEPNGRLLERPVAHTVFRRHNSRRGGGKLTDDKLRR